MDTPRYIPPKNQLLKWVGNKQKFALEITKYFPPNFDTFYEPFLGSGAIIATVAPKKGVGSDVFTPLMDIWEKLSYAPNELINWYKERRDLITEENKVDIYAQIRDSYNKNPNGADFLFLSRACYGGIIRFRKSDGYMSTPCGAHKPIPVANFERRVNEWRERLKNVSFKSMDYREAFSLAQKGDFIYCDPPYSHSQSILYGAQEFKLEELFEEIEHAKSKGVKVALSIDGKKKSGAKTCDLPIPPDLFEKEIFINCGSSMLKRFQIEGSTLQNENVSDRLLLTY
ncbi:Dam family site-specific DNA-(adenine-N6)-methyltransferase [Bacteroides sedimenti]|uniref:Site-specific DNA-methyltransferase (adenine-specific) n=1 Tax=Bacteroides sedimenti TaxID=2136147 RepID=A0ABM8IJN5_9BACE